MTDSSAPAQVVSALTPMQQALLDRVDQIFASIGQAGHAVAQQLPDIAVQYIAYGRAVNTVWVVLPLLVFILACWACWSVGIKNKYDLQGDEEGVAWLGAGLGITALIFFLCNLSDFILVWFAPKVYLIQQVNELVKSLHQP